MVDNQSPYATSFKDFLNSVMSQGAYSHRVLKPETFNVVSYQEFEGTPVLSQRTCNNFSVIDKSLIHVPFDEDAVDFYTSTITWEVQDQMASSFFSDVTEKTLAHGYCAVFKTDEDAIVTDYEPVFYKDGTVIGYLTGDSLITQYGIYQSSGSSGNYTKVDEGVELGYYHVFYTPDKLPIWWRAAPLINAYSHSLSGNEESLQRFAESILTITGVDKRQRMSDTDLENLSKSDVLAFESGITPDGSPSTVPTAGFISPPLNTEARESWSTRIRKEIYDTLHIPDFGSIGGNVSTDSLKIFMWRTIQTAKRYANCLKQEFDTMFEDVTYSVSLPNSKDNQAKTLNELGYLSTRTKIQELNPDWDDDRVDEELRRLAEQNELGK